MGACCLCACVFKLVLGILNTVILFVGLIIAGVGGALIGISNGSLALILQGVIYSVLSTINLVDKSTLDNAGNDFTQILHPAGIALLVVGLIIACLALLGYCGTSITILLKVYMVILVVLVVVECVLVACFFSGAFNKKMQEGANYTLTNYYVDITSSDVVSMIWNVVMLECKCCGLFGYEDFFYLKNETDRWPKNTTLKLTDGKTERVILETPLTCCKTYGNFPTVTFVDDHCAEGPINVNISNAYTGCWDAVSDTLSPYRPSAILIASAIIVVQALIALMAFIIIRDESGGKVNPV